MTKFVRFLIVFALIALVAVSILVHPAIAQGSGPGGGTGLSASNPGVQLTLTQLAAIGVIASALVVFFRLLLEMAMKAKFAVSDWVMIVIVYVVSFAVAIWWYPQALPPTPVFVMTDPVSWPLTLFSYIGNLLTALTAYAAAAGIIYEYLFQKVKNGLGVIVAPAAYGVTPAAESK